MIASLSFSMRYAFNTDEDTSNKFGSNICILYPIPRQDQQPFWDVSSDAKPLESSAPSVHSRAPEFRPATYSIHVHEKHLLFDVAFFRGLTFPCSAGLREKMP